MPDLPVDPDARDVSKARTLLRAGHDRRWWRYESENEPGYTDRRGRTYDGITYTIMRPPPNGVDEPDPARDERVLLLTEVFGYVLRAADERDAAADIAYRPELLPPD